ncbi:MAG TPA: hypothetical protein VF221_18240 [Chloroflexota bacterium]
MSYNRKPVAGEVKTLPIVPGGIERELDTASTGWPASLLERLPALDIAWLRGRRSLRVIAALEAKGIFVRGLSPLRGSDRDEDVGPLDGEEPPTASIHSALEGSRLDM